MGKPVIYAQFHTTFFIPGVTNGGNMKTTLTPGSSSLRNLEMNLEDNGMLLLEWTDGGFRHRYRVAAANIIGVKEESTRVVKAEINGA
jgi:hypothetical protein